MGDQLLGRELLYLDLLSVELRHLGYILQPNLPWYLEDGAACTVRTILIAPAFMGEGTCGGLDNCRLKNPLLVGE